jgi:long-chain acyl-CoA synthetase
MASAFDQLTAPGAPFELELSEGPHGPVRNFAKRHRSMGALVDAAGRRGAAEFLVQGERRVSFAEFASAVRGTAREWIGIDGLARGDRVAILGHNSIDWLIAAFAATSVGAVVVALNTAWSSPELEFVLQDSGSRFLVADSRLLARIDGQPWLPPSVRTLDPDGRPDLPRFSDLVRNTEEPFDSPVEEPDPFALLYTSGTTGSPKGCITTHMGTIAQIRLAILTGVLAKQPSSAPPESSSPGGGTKPTPPTLLATTPLFHVSGLHAGIGLALASGSKVVLTGGRFDPDEVVSLIEREHVTAWGAVPTMIHRVVDCPAAQAADLSSLQHVSVGGAPLPPDVLARAQALLGVRAGARLGNGYGLTETHGAITMNAGSDLTTRPTSVGRPTPLVDIRIMDSDGAPLPAGAVGEVEVSGPTVTAGYWNRPEATAEALSGGWLRTGDLGYLDAEGYLFLVDRVTQMIIRGGENVYCAEVEGVLGLASEVDEAAVFGVADADLGERVEAAVHLVPGMDATEAGLRSFVAERLAGYKVPDRIHMIGEPLPRNAAGKIMKDELRSLSSR